MNKITKEMCVTFIKDYYKAKVIIFVLLSIFLTIGLYFYVKKPLIIILAVTIMLILMLLLALKIKNIIKNINYSNFYVVEDVVINFKKRFRSGKSQGMGYDYIYKFERYGKYTISRSSYPTIEIPLHKERRINHKSVDKLSSESVNKGDMFYLLILERGKQEKIIKCFYKYHFDILKEDFNYIEGKYYCKEDQL